MPPRSLPTPLRPPVENCTIMSGQCLRIPARKRAELVGIRRRRAVVVADVHVYERGAGFVAACVDSICSATVIGTAGLSFFVGTEPVMATVMMHGVLIDRFGPLPRTRAAPPGRHSRRAPRRATTAAPPCQCRNGPLCCTP